MTKTKKKAGKPKTASASAASFQKKSNPLKGKARSIPSDPKERRIFLAKAAIAGIVLACSFLLIFARLGHYALWEDEADTALHGIGVLNTGDTSAVLGKNLVAYGGGICLVNLCDRVTPPLSSYLAAASMGLFGNTAAVARLPFALCGFLCVVLILYWLWKDKADWLTWALVGMGILGNASFFLYARQCRYYPAATLICVVLAYIYKHWNGTTKQCASFIVASLALFSTHYVIFLAFYAALGVDYLVWGRREIKPTKAQVLAFGLSHLVVCGGLAMIWNPLLTEYGGTRPHNDLITKLYLLWWDFRDCSTCEFGVGFVVAIAPLLYFVSKDRWLPRLALAICAYMVGINVFTPQRINIHESLTADIRYLVPLIPMGIILASRAIIAMTARTGWIAIGVGVIAFGSNILHGGPLIQGGIRSTISDYVQELIEAPTEPYTPVGKWINENVAEGQSIWVSPSRMMFSLMFLAPKPVYAWQLEYPPKPQFEKCDPIHFRLQVPPDYVVAFGPGVIEVQQTLQAWNRPDVQYSLAKKIDQFGLDYYRPELYWRVFKPITNYDHNLYSIYIFRRTSPPIQEPHK